MGTPKPPHDTRALCSMFLCRVLGGVAVALGSALSTHWHRKVMPNPADPSLQTLTTDAEVSALTDGHCRLVRLVDEGGAPLPFWGEPDQIGLPNLLPLPEGEAFAKTVRAYPTRPATARALRA